MSLWRIREYALDHIVAVVLLFYALFLSFLLGIFTYYVTHLPKELPQPVHTIRPAVPVDHVAVHWIRKYNPAISEADAAEMYRYIEATIERYKADPTYQQGAALKITPKLFLALILRESSARWQCISDHGAIGLTQVMPLHLETLHKAGVIETPEVEELLDTEANIRAGVHVLMMYAKGVDSITKALSRYNGGYKREKAGRGYARAVLKLYEEMEG